MKLKIKTCLKFSGGLALGLSLSAPAFAINGYFLLGYGAKQLGMAGAGVALPQDRIVGALNPAGMALVAPGFDVGLGVMHPIRGGEIDCRGIGACDREVSDSSRREIFGVPNMGYSRRLADGSTLGITLYANGGLNSTYDRALYEEAIARITGAMGGKATITDKLGVDFGQFVLAPSLSKSFGPVALGVGPLVQLQRFKAYGFGAFGGLSKDPGSLSDRGSEYLFGGGVRGGAIWTVTPSLSLGVEVSSPIYMEKSTKYNGLFAEDGGFDVPAHFTVGLAQKLLPTLTIAFDYQKIFFGDVGALGNPAPTAAEFLGVITPERRFGGSKGIGFGWRNQDVYRLGLLWKPGGHWQWRVGYSQCSSQITTDAVLFNIPTPSVMSQKVTGGFTYEWDSGRAVSLGYMHGFDDERRAAQTVLFGAPAKLQAGGEIVELAYHHRF